MHARHVVNDVIANLLKVIAEDPQRWQAYQQLARIMVRNEEFLAAEQYFQQAITLNPQASELHLQLGDLHLRTQQYQAAHTCYKQAIQHNPRHAHSYYMDAQALKNLGRHNEAILRLRTVFKLAPEHVQAFTECADMLIRQAQPAQAAAVLEKAIAAHPEHGLLHFRLGLLYQQLQEMSKAATSFDAAIAIQPTFAEAHHQRAILLHAAGKLDAALQSLDTVIALQPETPAAYNNRGVILCKQQHYTQAIADFRQAIQLNPHYAAAYCNLGIAQFELGESEAASQNLETALKYDAHHAQAQYTLSKLKLQGAAFAEGWSLYEARLKVLPQPHPFKPEQRWTGETALRGLSILIHAEQTLSDTLQFCRYIPLLKQLNPNQIIVEVPEALFSLLSQHWAHEVSLHVIKQGDRLPLFDVYCPMLSLPLALHSTTDTLPSTVPYLNIAEQYCLPWQTLLGPPGRQLRVGLNWCGDAANPQDALRSVPLLALAPLLHLEVEWHSLQKAFRREDHIMLKRFPALECHHPQLTDFTETAGLIMAMDLIISVDTAVAHLAAALGKPVWLLLPEHAHFRWLTAVSYSPWYPAMHLFRMQQGQVWEDVVDSVHQALSLEAIAHLRKRSADLLGAAD